MDNKEQVMIRNDLNLYIEIYNLSPTHVDGLAKALVGATNADDVVKCFNTYIRTYKLDQLE